MGSIFEKLGQGDGSVSFHSIGFPSEWGEERLVSAINGLHVSIQLGSPASGELQNEDSHGYD